MNLRNVFVLAAAIGAGCVFAEEKPAVPMTPVAVAVVPGAEWPDDAHDVTGVRLNLLVGRHRDVFFFDAGLLGDLVVCDACGLQVAGLYSHVGSAPGLVSAAGALGVCDGDFTGMQLAGLAAAAKGAVTGLQLGAICSAGDANALQVGVVNRAKNLCGLQVGVVNWAEESDGIQLGLVNVTPDGRYPVMPVFNFGF